MSSVQQTLRSQRERLGQSHGAAAASAKLPGHVPAALESGELSLDDATTLAYVRIYARHLGLDAEEVLRDCAVDAPAGHGGDAEHRPSARHRPGSLADRMPLAIVLGILGLLGLVLVVFLVRGDAGGPVDVELGAPSVADTTGAEATGLFPARSEDGGSATDAGDVGERSGEVDGRDGPDGREGREGRGQSDAPGTADTASDAGDTDVAGTAETDTADAAADDAADRDTGASLPGRAPEDTRVQVLHHGRDQATVDEVRAALEALGYQVAHVNVLATPVARTTVQAVTGWMVEAQSLRERDQRFARVEPNRVFSTEVHLHVLIGADWPNQT